LQPGDFGTITLKKADMGGYDIPLLCWVSAVIGWLVLSVEAVVAAPVWLVAHCMPEGEGFAGAHGRAGYTLFMSILLRPALLVLALLLCMILMLATGQVISQLFGPFMISMRGMDNGALTGSENIGIAPAIGLLIVLGGVISLMTWKMFDLVTAIPDRILRWAGQLLQNLGDEGRGTSQQAQGEARASYGRLSETATKIGGAHAQAGKGKQVGENDEAGKNQVGQNKDNRSTTREQNQRANAPFEMKPVDPKNGDDETPTPFQ